MKGVSRVFFAVAIVVLLQLVPVSALLLNFHLSSKGNYQNGLSKLPSIHSTLRKQKLGFNVLRSSMTDGQATPAAAGDLIDAKTLSSVDGDLKTVMTNEQIAKILPHRYPFLLVDRVVAFEPGKRICGIKCITANEPQFTGHFPDRPIMPGVLQIEAMAQLGGLLCLQPPVTSGEGQRIFFFTGVDGVRWKTPLVPGDRLFMEMSLVSFDDRMGFAKMTGKGFVRGKAAVTVNEFSFALAK